ncbi:hypothetical protein BY996DRAFT_6487888 [Phakopsora pachyrhizi]|nr:hypothetical protein BY996DRAFT_6487888 [Phakopsora pachyrhizi]
MRERNICSAMWGKKVCANLKCEVKALKFFLARVMSLRFALRTGGDKNWTLGPAE